MSLYTKACLVILGYFFSSIIVLNTCKKLEGYKFPVHSTKFCPGNESEWNNRSSALNCNKTNGYTCLPNENFTELLEFCYTAPFIWIQEGVCLYLIRKGSYVDAYSCSHFIDGCHNTSYQSSRIFDYPACITIGNGCFLAEQFCKSSPNTTHQPETSGLDMDDWLWVLIVIGIAVVVCFSSYMLYVYRKRKSSSCKRGNDIKGTSNETKESKSLIADTENVKSDFSTEHELREKEVLNTNTETEGKDSSYNDEFEETELLNTNTENDGMESSHNDELREKEVLNTNTETEGKDSSYNESQIEKDIFDKWKQEDLFFISTKACKEAEKIIRSRNLVIVAGHSGSGKSAIIQHIALKLRDQGWTVKRVKKIEDVMNEYSSSNFKKNKTICVFNNPFGKESFDEKVNNSWQVYEEELKLYLNKGKIMMSCRHHIIADSRMTRYLLNQSHIVVIDDNKNKLSVDEKRQILTKYTFNLNLSDKECKKIIEVERHFPLLCKLYSCQKDNKKKGIKFFTEPVTVLEEEILGFRKDDMVKYCALALLVLFNDDLCVSDLLKNKEREKKFKHTLKLCGLPKNTPPSAIGDNLNALEGFFVKTIGDTYHFYHDFVMDVTTKIFGRDYPAETVKYADIGLLRRRVKVGNCDQHDDWLTIYVSDRYIADLGERLYTELFGENLLDVVLNPCLRDTKVIQVLKEKIASHPENVQLFLQTKKLTIDKQKLGDTSKQVLLTKLTFLDLENQISPLSALIVFCHTQLSQYCLDTLQRNETDFISHFPSEFGNGSKEGTQTNVLNCYLSAVYCNGSKGLFDNVFKDQEKESLSETWGGLFPIHIVSVFHNYHLLKEIIKRGTAVNIKMNENGGWTPLIMAAGNDTQECEGCSHQESGETRRDKTVQLLLSSGADINLCMNNGVSPLSIACQKGHTSTVRLLLSKGADIHLCTKDRARPIHIACQGGHERIVQLLLNEGADINLRTMGGESPLYIACQGGHERIVQLLLSRGADINLCSEDGTSPLYIACQNGHCSTVQLLLSNKAYVNIRAKNGVSSLDIACWNGNDSTVQLLLNYGADINLCTKNDISLLYRACLKEHDSTVHIFYTDTDLRIKNGASPLYIACQNDNTSTVQLLLCNGADINLCTKDGTSPLYIASENGHDKTVQLLLDKRASINLCTKDGNSPLYIACQNRHDGIVKLLLSGGANINLCKKYGAGPLFVACYKGNYSTVQLLLNNGANINLCTVDGATPLYIACQNGHDRTVQLLLNNGADINLCTEDGRSPLYIACRNGHDRTVQLLLSNGGAANVPIYRRRFESSEKKQYSTLNINSKCKKTGANPLHVACENGHDSIVQLLLSKGADINLCTESGFSPLYMACQNGHTGIVQCLLSNGGKNSTLNINSISRTGANPLKIACMMGNDDIVKLLLDFGADINLCNKDEASPLYIAFAWRQYETVNVLLKRNADTRLSSGLNPTYLDLFDKNDSTIEYLLRKDNIYNNIYDLDSYFSLFVFCHVERMSRVLSRKKS